MFKYGAKSLAIRRTEHEQLPSMGGINRLGPWLTAPGIVNHAVADLWVALKEAHRINTRGGNQFAIDDHQVELLERLMGVMRQRQQFTKRTHWREVTVAQFVEDSGDSGLQSVLFFNNHDSFALVGHRV